MAILLPSDYDCDHCRRAWHIMCTGGPCMCETGNHPTPKVLVNTEPRIKVGDAFNRASGGG